MDDNAGRRGKALGVLKRVLQVSGNVICGAGVFVVSAFMLLCVALGRGMRLRAASGNAAAKAGLGDRFPSWLGRLRSNWPGGLLVLLLASAAILRPCHPRGQRVQDGRLLSSEAAATDPVVPDIPAALVGPGGVDDRGFRAHLERTATELLTAFRQRVDSIAAFSLLDSFTEQYWRQAESEVQRVLQAAVARLRREPFDAPPGHRLIRAAVLAADEYRRSVRVFHAGMNYEIRLTDQTCLATDAFGDLAINGVFRDTGRTIIAPNLFGRPVHIHILEQTPHGYALYQAWQEHMLRDESVIERQRELAGHAGEVLDKLAADIASVWGQRIQDLSVMGVRERALLGKDMVPLDIIDDDQNVYVLAVRAASEIPRAKGTVVNISAHVPSTLKQLWSKDLAWPEGMDSLAHFLPDTARLSRYVLTPYHVLDKKSGELLATMPGGAWPYRDDDVFMEAGKDDLLVGGAQRVIWFSFGQERKAIEIEGSRFLAKPLIYGYDQETLLCMEHVPDHLATEPLHRWDALGVAWLRSDDVLLGGTGGQFLLLPKTDDGGSIRLLAVDRRGGAQELVLPCPPSVHPFACARGGLVVGPYLCIPVRDEFRFYDPSTRHSVSIKNALLNPYAEMGRGFVHFSDGAIILNDAMIMPKTAAVKRSLLPPREVTMTWVGRWPVWSDAAGSYTYDIGKNKVFPLQSGRLQGIHRVTTDMNGDRHLLVVGSDLLLLNFENTPSVAKVRPPAWTVGVSTTLRNGKIIGTRARQLHACPVKRAGRQPHMFAQAGLGDTDGSWLARTVATDSPHLAAHVGRRGAVVYVGWAGQLVSIPWALADNEGRSPPW